MTATPQQCAECGAPASEERTAEGIVLEDRVAEGVVLHLCAAHAAEWDRDEAAERPAATTTPRERRHRPIVSITLSREALERLDALARKRGLTRSGAVEQLVRTAKQGHSK